MAGMQFTQLLVQRLQSHALQWRTQGGAQRLGHGPAALAHELPRQMRGHTLAGNEFAPLQRGLREENHAITLRRWHGGVHCLQNRACALPDLRAGRIGRAHQSCCHGGFAVVQPRGGLAEQGAAQRVNADQLAAKRHQIQIGFQNLVFAPAAFQHLGRHGLAYFLDNAAAATRAPQVFVEQTGQLHGDGGSTTGFAAPDVGPGRRRYAAPVDAAMLVKTLVLAEDQSRAQGWRDVFQSQPLACAHGVIGADTLQKHAIAVQYLQVRRAVSRLDVRVPRSGERRTQQPARGQQTQRAARQRHAHQRAASTRTRMLGVAPNISGAYMASIRDGGIENSPTLFSRSVYSTLVMPLGK